MTPYLKESFCAGFDGTKISYRIAGRGKKTLLCFNGVGVAKWAWLPIEKNFSDKYRVVTWDYRGHGLSGPVSEPSKAQFTNLAEDAICLIDHLKIKSAFLLGHSAGLHVALEVMRKKRALVKGLISCLGTPGKSLETFMESFIGQIVFDLGYIMNAVMPETSHFVNTGLLKNPVTYQIGALLKLVNPAIEGKSEVDRYLSDITNIDFSLFNHLVASGSKMSAEDMFSKIRIPTLLIAAEYDRFVPISIAKKMHEKIRHSELFIIKNGTHAAMFEQPDIFNLLIERFLA